MANHPSALKRFRQSEKRRARNQANKSEVRTAVKKARAATTEASKEDALKAITDAQVALARAGSKNVFHKRTIARRISRLALLKNKLVAGKLGAHGDTASAPAKARKSTKAPKAAKAAK